MDDTSFPRPGGFDILFIFHVSRLLTPILEVVKWNNPWIGGWEGGWMDEYMDECTMRSSILKLTLRDEKETKQGVGSSTLWMKHVDG
jgi:hypothetical protein